MVYHSRTFKCRLFTQLWEMSGFTDNVKVKFRKECRKDIIWWRNFIKVYNGVTMIKNDKAIQLTLPQLMDTPVAVCVYVRWHTDWWRCMARDTLLVKTPSFSSSRSHYPCSRERVLSSYRQY